MASEEATNVLIHRETLNTDPSVWRRLSIMLCPQRNLYEMLAKDDRIHGTVLEVGFGTGAQVAQFAHKANWIDAIEIDPKAVEFAKKWWPLKNVDWTEGDICSYFSPEVNAYDVILCFEVLEHTEDPVQAIRNMAEALKPSGDLFLSVPNGSAPDPDRLHKWAWSPDDLKQDFGTYFAKVQVIPAGRLMFVRCAHA